MEDYIFSVDLGEWKEDGRSLESERKREGRLGEKWSGGDGERGRKTSGNIIAQQK